MQDAETKEEEQEQEQEVVVEEEKTEDAGETQEVDAADEDLSEYSESVKKRISKLTNRFREEERQKQSAIEFAESVKKQNDDLKARLDKLDTNYVGEVDNRVTAQAQAAKEAYKKALESGDADALYDAQQNISRIAMEEARLKDLKARQEEKKATATNGAAPPPPQTPTPPPPQKPDPRAEQWAQENEWFGKDQTMTYAAFGVHKQLIESEGFDPNTEEYYTELDNRIKSEFPHKFTKKSSGPRVASAGATASKTVSKGRRTVKLTPSQIAIAKKLGVPLEEYAKHVKE
ncbi:MAG: hypothetical protein CMI74_10445 [Candidatus Pelagibacter sp.]|jgi:hypothetical protein|nr:hypothetical protein [Candidatus Pelagibacter sp.]|tara:strand:+ start:6184 stop:7050 length:867 start_codon:yes stop_codon:yes gene_type:complete